MSKGFVENVRKCGAHQLVDHGPDKRQSQLPHAVDDTVGQLIQRLTQQLPNVQLHAADAIHLNMHLEQRTWCAHASHTCCLTRAETVSNRNGLDLIVRLISTCNRRGSDSNGPDDAALCPTLWPQTRTAPRGSSRESIARRRCADLRHRCGTWSPRSETSRTRRRCVKLV